ncbi:Acetyltransferase, partial [Globisporangium splendens]
MAATATTATTTTTTTATTTTTTTTTITTTTTTTGAAVGAAVNATSSGHRDALQVATTGLEVVPQTSLLASLRPSMVTPLLLMDAVNGAHEQKQQHQQLETRHCKEQQMPGKVQLGPITESNVSQLRQLNVQIFPVRYNDAFYRDILRMPRDYSKLAYVGTNVVGAICCRLEPLETHPVLQRTYIMTLGVLEAYRQCQIGALLLRHIISQSIRDGVDHIYLHVQTSNSVAIQFYHKFGFEIAETIRNYYKRIEPPDCYILLKRLRQPNT